METAATNEHDSADRVARSWLTWGAVHGFLAVICGAFAAHGLDKFCVEKYAGFEPKTIAGHTIPASYKYLADFKTAAEYQMYHALALLAVGVLALRGTRRSLQVAGWCFQFGILLFSGSLYLLVLSGVTRLGMVTPIGGVLFLAGWIALAMSARR